MKFLKKKLLPCLFVLVLLLAMVPVMVFTASAETVVVSTEEELKAAVDAIPQGGSGEITVEDVYMVLSEGLYFEEKDVTFNLVNAQLVTTEGEYGGQPVIFGFGANITINADENSTMAALGHTGMMGVVRVDNSTDWNEETKTFAKDFNVTINGGSYACLPEDSLIVAAPGTNVVLSDVICSGTVEAIAMEGVGITVPGKLSITSGIFSNDVEEYVADGKYFCKNGESYYVREEEMTDDFKAALTDGKLVLEYAKTAMDEESLFLLSEDFWYEHPDFYLDTETFNEDFTTVELVLNWGTAKEEVHVVDVVWDYDAEVLESAQSFVEKFPEDRPWFTVNDLELVNYWVHHDPLAELDSLANYSGELKAILGNKNFSFIVEDRAGSGEPLYTEVIGSAKLMHDGKVYFASGMLGARAEHAIHVSENTADTKEALLAAAQKRIDDYIGKGIVTLTAKDETVTEYYNETLAQYDRDIAEARQQLAAEMAKPEEERDWFVIMDCQSVIDYTPEYKQYFIDSFAEGGENHFLSRAEGAFLFSAKVTEREYAHDFIIIKDDDKLTTPTYATVDLNTNVSVTTDSPSVPLDTVVQISKLTEGDEYDRIIKILNVDDNETFDIKLYSASLDDYVTKLDDGKFEVKLPIPEKFKGKSLVVYYVDQNGKPVEYEVTEEGAFATFTTDHFSIYTLAEKVAKEPEHAHSGGTATCCEKAVCTACKQVYGELDQAKHAGGTEVRGAKAATATEKGYTGDTYCKGCGKKLADGKEIPQTEVTPPSPPTGNGNNLWVWAVLAFVSGIFALANKKRSKA